ncbi:MAG TPA: hypothetical protein VF246_08570 [Acidimicrobiia bacterium]
MTGLISKVVAGIFGEPGPAGRLRVLTGLRTRDPRQLTTGLALLGLAYLRRSQPRRQLVYRKVLREDDALLIRVAGPDTRPIDRKKLRGIR